LAITIVTAAASNNFVTLEAVKTELGITGSDEDDLLSELLEEVASTIETICDRTFAEQRVIETVPGYGTTDLLLSLRPITTIHEILFDESVVDSDLYSFEPESAIVHAPNGWRSTHSSDQSITVQQIEGSETRYYAVNYTAGYTMADEDPSTLPKALTRIAKDMVTTFYKGRGYDKAIKSERLGDASWTYSHSEVMDEFRSRLSRWIN